MGLSVLAMGLHGIIPYCPFHPNGTIGWDGHMGLSGFTWDVNHPLCPNGMIGWVIVQWLLYGMRITCSNLLVVQWDIENPIGHLLAVLDMPR